VVADTLAALEDAAAGEGEAAHRLAIEPARALAVWQRKAADAAAAPVSRGAALGAALSLAGRDGAASTHRVADALQLLQSMPAATLGDALTGLLALAREALSAEPAFAAGMDRMVQALDNAEFVLALPALRAAFAWLPPQERGDLAGQVLALHDAGHLSRRALTGRLAAGASAEDQAAARAAEAAVLQRLAAWGIDPQAT